MQEILTIKKDNNIIWLVVILHLLNTFILKPETFLVVELIAIFLLILGSRRVIIPKINGLGLYFGYIIVISVMGLFRYGASLAQRDLFYQLSSIMTIVLGYLIYMMYENKEKSLWSTVCLMLFISSIICLLQGILSLTGTIEFVTFRSTFEVGILSISLILPIMAGKMLFFKENTLPWKLDIVAVLVWIIQIVLNLSRTAIVNLGVSAVAVLIVVLAKKRIRFFSFVRLISFQAAAVVIVIVLTSLMPTDAKKTFSDKMDNMFEEVSDNSNYRDSESAQDDWRGYENSEALKQWERSDLLTKVFGAGNGKLIKIEFVPSQWKYIIEKQSNTNGVTILHNTFYTLLIKGGIILVALLIIFLIRNALLAIKMIRSDDFIFEGVILLCVVAYIVVDGYVVRTMMDKGVELTPMLLLGYINAKYYRSGNEEVEEDEEKV